MDMAYSMIGRSKKCIQFLVGKPEGKK